MCCPSAIDAQCCGQSSWHGLLPIHLLGHPGSVWLRDYLHGCLNVSWKVYRHKRMLWALSNDISILATFKWKDFFNLFFIIDSYYWFKMLSIYLEKVLNVEEDWESVAKVWRPVKAQNVIYHGFHFANEISCHLFINNLKIEQCPVWHTCYEIGQRTSISFFHSKMEW